MRENLKAFFGLSEPKYHELSAYLTALTCAILFISYPDFRTFVTALRDSPLAPPSGERTGAFFIVGVFALTGFMLSIYHVFTNARKTVVQRFFMGAFTICANALAGIKCGVEMLGSKVSLLVIFPVLNIAMGLILLYRFRQAQFDITGENASLWEVLSSTLVCLVIFAIAFYILHLTWAMTFSICVFYSSALIFLVKRAIDYFNFRASPR